MTGAGRVEKQCVEDWIFTTYLVDAKPGGAATVVGQRLPPGKVWDHSYRREAMEGTVCWQARELPAQSWPQRRLGLLLRSGAGACGSSVDDLIWEQNRGVVSPVRTGFIVRCNGSHAESFCQQAKSLKGNGKLTSSAEVKGPMRRGSKAPNQTRVVLLDAFGCSTVRLGTATHPLSLVEFREVRITRRIERFMGRSQDNCHSAGPILAARKQSSSRSFGTASPYRSQTGRYFDDLRWPTLALRSCLSR